jgi:hypothetical protein
LIFTVGLKFSMASRGINPSSMGPASDSQATRRPAGFREPIFEIPREQKPRIRALASLVSFTCESAHLLDRGRMLPGKPLAPENFDDEQQIASRASPITAT